MLVTVFCFIFVIFKNVNMKFSQNVENQFVNPLYLFLEPICNNFSENTESMFRSPDYLSFSMRQWI